MIQLDNMSDMWQFLRLIGVTKGQVVSHLRPFEHIQGQTLRNAATKATMRFADVSCHQLGSCQLQQGEFKDVQTRTVLFCAKLSQFVHWFLQSVSQKLLTATAVSRDSPHQLLTAEGPALFFEDCQCAVFKFCCLATMKQPWNNPSRNNQETQNCCFLWTLLLDKQTCLWWNSSVC